MGINVLKKQLVPERNIRTLIWLQHLSFPSYWKCGKALGVVGIIVLAILHFTGHTPHLAAIAVILHVVSDFTAQSPETAERKPERGRHLLLHALTAGGIPLAVVGLMTGNPARALVWTVIGVASHYAVDWTRRFGLRDTPLGIVLDQSAHLLIILTLVLTG
jgi:hypothetical protein